MSLYDEKELIPNDHSTGNFDYSDTFSWDHEDHYEICNNGHGREHDRNNHVGDHRCASGDTPEFPRTNKKNNRQHSVHGDSDQDRKDGKSHVRDWSRQGDEQHVGRNHQCNDNRNGQPDTPVSGMFPDRMRTTMMRTLAHDHPSSRLCLSLENQAPKNHATKLSSAYEQ